MARQINRLNARSVMARSKVGRHADGGGLYLSISDNGGKRWVFLFRRGGRTREMGLGAAGSVSLAVARELAGEARQLVARGLDPIEARATPSVAVPTFGDMAERLITAMRPSWKNAKHAAQWEMTLLGRVADKKSETGWRAAEIDYCAELRSLRVNVITTGDVLAVLAPIWEEVPETASRLRGRVLAAAKAGGHRSGENPARWPDNLKELLPKRRRLTRGHHPAMRYALVPAFMGRLRDRKALAAMALEITILTAARSNESLHAEWTEFELQAVPVTTRDDEGKEYTVMGPCWAVPPERMKMERPHMVPLAPRAVALLEQLKNAGDGRYVFPGQKADKPLSSGALERVLDRMGVNDATPHGFRSSFRDWAAETTPFPSEVVDMALAHAIEDKVDAAYRRGVLFDKRRELMNHWAAYCGAAQ